MESQKILKKIFRLFKRLSITIYKFKILSLMAISKQKNNKHKKLKNTPFNKETNTDLNHQQYPFKLPIIIYVIYFIPPI